MLCNAPLTLKMESIYLGGKILVFLPLCNYVKPIDGILWTFAFSGKLCKVHLLIPLS
jgi:hypothetical protein